MFMERREQQNLNLDLNTHFIHSDNKHEQTKKSIQQELFPSRWSRIGFKAQDLTSVFSNLQTHVNAESLKEAFDAIDGTKALGVDGTNKSRYAKNLDANLNDLAERIQKGTYRVKPRKEVLIPKGKDKLRPIAIACFEDKLVDWVASKILTQIYEPMFIRNSFGFRPGKSTDDAIKATYYSLNRNNRPYVVEIDFKNFFNTIPHRKLIKILGKKIKDNRFKGLIGRFLLADTINADGELIKNTIGTPQGSIMSPILANIYLNEVVDQWFVENHGAYNKIIVRYADDIVFFFKKEDEASEFLKDFRVRITNYDLQINEDKTQIIDFNKKSNNSFNFLGFTFYWGKQWKKKYLKVKTQKEKLIKAFQEFDLWIKEIRNKIKLKEIWNLAKSKLLGHYNYYGYWMNNKKLWNYYSEVIKSLFKWLNRRSQKRSYDWESFKERLMNLPLPKPKVEDLKKLGWSPYVQH